MVKVKAEIRDVSFTEEFWNEEIGEWDWEGWDAYPGEERKWVKRLEKALREREKARIETEKLRDKIIFKGREELKEELEKQEGEYYGWIAEVEVILYEMLLEVVGEEGEGEEDEPFFEEEEEKRGGVLKMYLSRYEVKWEGGYRVLEKKGGWRLRVKYVIYKEGEEED